MENPEYATDKWAVTFDNESVIEDCLALVINVENGKIIEQVYTDKQLNSINTTNCKSGLYFIKIKTDKNTILKKIVVE